MLLLIGISTFVCITLAMMGAYWLLSRPQSAATVRLKRLGESNGSATVVPVSIVEEHSGEKFAERIASPLNRLVPPSAAEVQKLQKQLMHAGFRSRNAPIIYRAIQLTSLAGFPAAVALTCALLARPLNSAFVWILFAFVIGFFLPRYVLNRMIRSRRPGGR